MSRISDDPHSQHECPHCHAAIQTPMYVFAHWKDDFTVTCTAGGCGKKYTYFQGFVEKLNPRKKRKTP